METCVLFHAKQCHKNKSKRIVSRIAACTDPKHHGLTHKIDRQLEYKDRMNQVLGSVHSSIIPVAIDAKRGF